MTKLFRSAPVWVSVIGVTWFGTFVYGEQLPAEATQPASPQSATASIGATTKPVAERIGEGRFRIGKATVDQSTKTVTVPGHINMEKGVIELLACGPRGKTHESVLVLDVEPIHLQTALLLLGLDTGAGVRYQGDPALPKGDPVEVWVEWEIKGEKNRHRGEDLVLNLEKNQPMKRTHWVFVGSAIIDGVFAAEIDQSYITTYHDPFTILDNPLSTGGDDTIYAVNSALVPSRGTPVKVTFRSLKESAPAPEEPSPEIRSGT